MKRILSIDGGGIRGIIPAMYLAALEARTGKPVHEQFDLIAGTSTGGILALMCVAPQADGKPLPAAAAVELYEKHGPDIFRASWWQKVKTSFGVTGAKYPAAALEAALKKYLGDAKLSAALIPVLIPSYDIEQRRPLFFKSHDADTAGVLMRDAARATSAAPTYFKPAKVPRPAPLGYAACVDGGLVASNPAACAYAEAQRLWPGEDISVLSLGCGGAEKPILLAQAEGWGVGGWARRIIDCTFDGVSDAVDYQLRHLLPAGAYTRINPKLDAEADTMDGADPDTIRRLKIAA